MSQYAGKRRSTEDERRSRRKLWVGFGGAAIIVAGIVFAIVRGTTPAPTAQDSARPAATSAGSSGPGAPAGALPACSDAAVIAVPPGYDKVWSDVAGGYARAKDPGAGCAPVSIVTRPSAGLAAGGPALSGLDAWIPEDSSWTDRLAAAAPTALSGTPTVVAHSPLVAVFPQAMAAAAGITTGAFTPATMRDLITLAKTWADLGHPEWGTLRIAIPDPSASATGAVAFAALTAVATDGRPPTTIDYTAPTPDQLAVIKLEHRIAATPADDAAVLSALGSLDARVGATDPAGPGIWITTESALLAAEAPARGAGRVAIHLGNGAAAVTMAVARLSGGREGPVGDFVQYLSSSPGTASLAAAGLRTADSRPAAAALAAVGIASTPLTEPVRMPAADVQTVAMTFAFMHVRLSSMVVLDASWSMTRTFPGSQVRKIDLVAALARQTLAIASPRARSGLVTFQTDNTLQPQVNVAARLMPNGDDDGGVPHAQRMLQAVTSLQVRGGTPLHEAILVGYREALTAWDPGYVNQLVVLSDGAHEDAARTITRAELLQQLAALADPKRPIKVILLGYGADADMAALNEIAAATGGKAVAVGSLDVVGAATREALFTP